MKNRHAPGQYLPVVITSTHLLKWADQDPLYLPFRVMGRDREMSFVVVKVGGGKGRRPFYVSHPDFDVAAFPLELPAAMKSQFAFKFLDEKDLGNGDVRAGQNVSFLGFPEGFAGTSDLFPVLRQGCVASYDPRMSAAPLFLVNGDVYPGDSGAPVFNASKTGKLRLVGMVIQRVTIREGERSSIALAVDGSVVRETLDQLAGRAKY